MSAEPKTRYLVSDADLGEAEALAAAEVVRSKWLSVGPRTASFEESFASYLGTKHAVMVSNCTAALHLALLAVGVGPGDEVIVPAYTFVASVNAVLYCNSTPVFVDIAGAHDLNLDIEDLASKITPRTKAVVIVHMAGYACDMDAVMSLSKQHGFAVVEDACHAIGARYQGVEDSPLSGKAVGTLGHVGCFSFFANKNLVTGEGGMVVTADDDIARKTRLGRSHGMTKTSYERATGRASSYDVVQYGFNYRATEITAAIASIQLEKLDRNNAQRRKLVARYRQHLLDHPLLTIPFAPRLEDSAHHVMPVVLSDASLRDPLREALEKDGVQTTVHYPPAHRFTHIRAVVKEMPELPMTDDIVDRELTLPLHPLLSESDIDEICGRLKRCLDAVAAVGNGARSAGGFSSAEEYGSERNA